MQADVVPLIISDSNRKFRLFNTFGRFDVGPNNVDGLSGGHSLGKLATAVGHPFPASLFLLSTPDFDANARGRLVFFRPHGAEDECVGLAGLRIISRKQRRQRSRSDQE